MYFCLHLTDASKAMVVNDLRINCEDRPLLHPPFCFNRLNIHCFALLIVGRRMASVGVRSGALATVSLFLALISGFRSETEEYGE